MKEITSYFTLLIALSLLVFSGCSKPKVRFEALYIDMDGTTLDSNHEVRPATIAVLEQYKRCGGKVGIATGRTFEQVAPYIDVVKPNLPLVLYNGGLAINGAGDEVYYTAELADAEVIAGLSKIGELPGVKVVIVHYYDDTLVNILNEDVRESLKSINVLKLSECEDLHACIEERKAKDGKLPIKAMVWVDPRKIEGVKEELIKRIGDKARILVGNTYIVEVLPNGVDKAVTIAKILAERGIPRENVATFGDSGNDVGMMREFPVSMAMSNGREETRDAALFTIDTNDTDTISRTIKRLVLLDACKGNPAS